MIFPKINSSKMGFSFRSILSKSKKITFSNPTAINKNEAIN